MPTESSSDVSPVSVNLFLQYTTRAATERTLAMGAKVAAIRGMAVDANHQSLRSTCQIAISYQTITALTLDRRHQQL